MKVTAEGGETYWSTKKYFRTLCNENSASIILPSDDDTYIYYMNGSDPYYFVNSFSSSSEACTIESYELHHIIEEDYGITTVTEIS